MELACSNCQTSYRIADEKVPAGGARANCPSCGHLIIIPGSGVMDRSGSPLLGPSGADYGQTMAYDFSEVDQSQTEISTFLEKISGQEPFLAEGVALYLRDIQTGRTYPLSGAQATVGRSGSDINVDDPEVSRRHCLVRIFGDQAVIVDLESTNGTHVRGRKVQTTGIGFSEQFTIGNTTLQLMKKGAE